MAASFKSVTAESPCKICKHGDFCQLSIDEAVQMCMRISDGSFKTKDTSVGTAYFHQLIPREEMPGYKPVIAEWNGEAADADTRHKVYDRLLSESTYSDSHRLELLKRKAPLPFGHHRYGTLRKQGLSKIIAKLREEFGDAVLLSVPGFVVKRSAKGDLYITLNGKPGLMIPVRDDAGRILGIKIRIDGATSGGGGKYRWLSSKQTKYLPFAGPMPGVAVHCPLTFKDRPLRILRVTEGPLKADVANANGDIPTIAADSVGTLTRLMPLIETLKPDVVRIATDMDREKNPAVAAATVKFAGALEEKRIDVEIEKWPTEHKGIDDALVAGATIEVITGEDVSCYLLLLDAIAKKNCDADDGRREIEITVDEHETNDDAAEALTLDREIYQRGGMLVRIVTDGDRNDGIRRASEAPRIAMLKSPTVRDRLSRVARFGMTVTNEEGEEKFERKPIPQRCIEAVIDRGYWHGIRSLEGVVSAPVLRHDGSVLSTPGYDVATGLYFDPQGVEFIIPQNPTRADAIAAAGRLLDLICDFPHPRPAHRSTWLAGLLTPSARFAFDGPSPLFLFDGNAPGSGKTLESELIALIQTGGDFARMSNPHNDEEARKLITALVIAGDPLVLVDNIGGQLGCPPLDAALTGTIWQDRLLGKNERIRGRLVMTWYGSGNNVILNGDTTRRICHCRLQSPEERPEERQGFKYSDLKSHVQQNRAALLADVLTILAGYCAAGRPIAKIKSWGSYEGWSGLVRQSIVWCGLADPADSRLELAEQSNRDILALRELMAGWEEVDEDCTGLTAAVALQKLKDHHSQYQRLRNVVADLWNCKPGDLPGARQLGNKLRHLRGRVCGGKCFDEREIRGGYKAWRVVSADRRGDSDESGDSSGTLFTRDEATNSTNDTHTHTHAEKDKGAGKESPQSPESPAVIHRDVLCGSEDSWLCTNGNRYCRTCQPPLSQTVVVQEGSAA